LLDDRLLPSLMLPRSEIEWLEASDTVAQALEKASASGHSWYPVCRGGLDDVVGVVKVAVLLVVRDLTKGASAPVAPVEDRVGAYAVPAIFVPESLSGMELLEQFRARSTRILLVVDEYGVVQGLVTPMDMLEAITGELPPGAEVGAWATQRPDGSWLLDGVMPVSELKARLDIKQLPEEERSRYYTLAGLLQSVSGRLPGVGEGVDCACWRFDVLVLDGKRIDKVVASRQTSEAVS
jgi:putative hemolysin